MAAIVMDATHLKFLLSALQHLYLVSHPIGRTCTRMLSLADESKLRIYLRV